MNESLNQSTRIVYVMWHQNSFGFLYLCIDMRRTMHYEMKNDDSSPHIIHEAIPMGCMHENFKPHRTRNDHL